MSTPFSSFEERFATALQCAEKGDLSNAVPLLATLARERPAVTRVRYLLVRCLLQAGHPERALAEACHPALLNAPDAAAAAVGDFAASGAMRQRAELLRAFLQRFPNDYDAALALAAATHSLGCPSAALRWAEHAAALRPEESLPREIRAVSLVDRGDVEAGLAAYRKLLPHGTAEAAARYLVLAHYDPEQDNAALFTTHRDYAQRHLRRFGSAFARTARDPEPPLRIGWLSPRLEAGPVATFLEGLLAHFDRSRHRHLLINLMPAQDSTARRLQALADEAIDASGLDDVHLLQRLRALDLDVLVDLAGHATSNRIGVIAQRVAPLQLCWLDWFDTTAVAAMDAWISDAWLTPPGSTQCYSEKIVRLATGRFCYTPADPAPPASREGSGAVVFASFNRLAKLNDGVLDAWAEILQRVPDAVLEIRARHLDEPATRAHILERFAARGITPGRLRLHGEVPYHDLLAAWRHVDIALDPFPFSGCTTTCDALWMGCPTVTLPGETFVSRQSASLLWRLGRDEWVARDRADYVARAIGLATNIESVRAGREQLREAVRLSLCDAQAQADEFADALRTLWRERCSTV